MLWGGQSLISHWVSGSGCPTLTANFFWNRKRNHIEFAMRVTNEAVRKTVRDTVTLRIHEMEVGPSPWTTR